MTKVYGSQRGTRIEGPNGRPIPNDWYCTKGRCRNCNIVWWWNENKDRRLRDTRCPKCGGRLGQTTHLVKIQWRQLPADKRNR